MLEDNKGLVELGFSFIAVKAKSKAPTDTNWSKLPTKSYRELRQSLKPGQNIGMRHGKHSKLANGRYAHCLDIDIRDPDYKDEALDALRKILPDYKKFPRVKSGSGGPSFHVHFTTDEPLQSKKLARSKEKFTDKQGKSHHAWEIELFGTGKQTVMPPSVHPDTGNKYEWIKEYSDEDLDDIEDGFDVHYIPNSEILNWRGVSDDMASGKRPRIADNDDLQSWFHQQPTNVAIDEIESILVDLPADWLDDYELWLKVGAALHHEFDGDDEGLDLWHWISKKGERKGEENPKYDPDVLDDKWASFKGSKTPTTLRTLIKAANKERTDRGWKEQDEALDDDIDKDDAKPDKSWRKRIDTDSNGTMKTKPGNIKLVFENDPKVSHLIGFNEFKQTQVLLDHFKPITPDMFFIKCEDKKNGMRWPDTADVNARIYLESRRKYGGYGAKVTDRDLLAGLSGAAETNRFHPVKEFIESTEWDGTPRIDTLFPDYLKCPNNSYTREASGLIMIGAVTRIYEPGHKFDFVPILESPQGVKKTTFVKVLSNGWFNNLHPDFHDDKKMVESMLGYWIMELPELAGFARSDIKTIKQFITTGTDVARLSYAKRAQEFKRQCVFIGSTNDYQYLVDDTGNRRYWPIKVEVKTIDTDKLARNLKQLWAEALHRYRQMRKDQPYGDLPLYIRDPHALELAGIEQAAREESTVSDAYVEKIVPWLEGDTDARFDDLDGDRDPPKRRNEVTCLEVWENCMNQDVRNYTATVAKQIGAALNKIDFFERVKSTRTAKDGRRAKVWRRKGEEFAKPGRRWYKHRNLI